MARNKSIFRQHPLVVRWYLIITCTLGNLLIIKGLFMGTLKYDLMSYFDLIITIITSITSGT